MSDDNQILRLKPFVDLLMELCHKNVASTLTNNYEPKTFKTDDAFGAMYFTIGGYFEQFYTEYAMYLHFGELGKTLKLLYYHNRTSEDNPITDNTVQISEAGRFIKIEAPRDDNIGVLLLTLLDNDSFMNVKEFTLPFGLEEGQFFQYSTVEALPIEYNDYVYITSLDNVQKEHSLCICDFQYLQHIPQLHLDELYQTLLSKVQPYLDSTFDLR